MNVHFFNSNTALIPSTHLPPKHSGVLYPQSPQLDGGDEEKAVAGLQMVVVVNWRVTHRAALSTVMLM